MSKIFVVSLGDTASKGFTISEILLALAASGFVILLIGTIYVTGTNSSQMLESVITRDGLQRDILRALRNMRALAFTCDNNANFRACFVAGGASCESNVTNDFLLYDASGRQITGSTAAPVFYSRTGSQVAAIEPMREFQVTTSFRAQGYPIDFAGNGYQFLLRDFPVAGRLHEMLIVTYRIRHIPRPGEIALAARDGGFTIPLDEKYRLTGCPVVVP